MKRHIFTLITIFLIVVCFQVNSYSPLGSWGIQSFEEIATGIDITTGSTSAYSFVESYSIPEGAEECDKEGDGRIDPGDYCIGDKPACINLVEYESAFSDDCKVITAPDGTYKKTCVECYNGNNKNYCPGRQECCATKCYDPETEHCCFPPDCEYNDTNPVFACAKGTSCCDLSKGEGPESCGGCCDKDGDGIEESCFLCNNDPTDGNTEYTTCYMCPDYPPDQLKDSCYQCDNNNDGRLDGCYRCFPDENGRPTKCYVRDARHNDGIKDDCFCTDSEQCANDNPCIDSTCNTETGECIDTKAPNERNCGENKVCCDGICCPGLDTCIEPEGRQPHCSSMCNTVADCGEHQGRDECSWDMENVIWWHCSEKKCISNMLYCKYGCEKVNPYTKQEYGRCNQQPTPSQTPAKSPSIAPSV
jgi:hypothetical protein